MRIKYKLSKIISLLLTVALLTAGTSLTAFALDEDLGWQHAILDTERAWEYTKGEGVVVAIIDSGIDIYHPEFAGRILPNSYNSYSNDIGIEYVDNDSETSHGTHIAGIIAASDSDGNDVSGIAPGVSLLIIKYRDDINNNLIASLRGINYAVANGADIINISFGIYYDLVDLSDSYDQYEMKLFRDIVLNAVESGVTVICGAGNNRGGRAIYPALFPESVAVSAVMENGRFANYISNHGPDIDIAAPGEYIYSTAIDGGYVYMDGTSMATPHVAGVAALIKSLHPEYTPAQVKETLYATAIDAGELGRDDFYGHGIVNAYAAVLGKDALHSVTYEPGNGGDSYTVRVIPGELISEPDRPTREGFVFDGWITPEGTHFDFGEAVTESVTLRANWTEAPADTFADYFPDANFRAFIIDMLNLDGGSRTDFDPVSDSDLAVMASIPILEIDNLDICDLTGIERFSGLEILRCNNNRLRSLDITDNSGLTILSCSGNQLQSIDVSDNLLLEGFACADNNLTELELTHNVNLETLMCSWNQIKELSLPQGNALLYLDCRMNYLTELNVKQNTGLETLNCDTNLLSEIDLSGNAMLTELHCNSNRLEALDLANNPALTVIGCTSNMLGELDISHNHSLRELYCMGNQMGDDPDRVIGWENYWDEAGTLGDDNYFQFYTQDGDSLAQKPMPPAGFVSVVNIAGVPSKTVAGVPLNLSGTVMPSKADNKEIVWLLRDAGSTGATLIGNVLNTKAPGSVIVTAAIMEGAADGDDILNYYQDFEISVGEKNANNDTDNGGGSQWDGSSDGGSSDDNSGIDSNPPRTNPEPNPPVQPYVNPFADVDPAKWYAEAVAFVHKNGLMNGTGTKPMTFSPEMAVSRGMFATILWNLTGNPSESIGHFSDVEESAYYYEAVNWAAAEGIVYGVGNGLYAPETLMSRQDLAVMLYRYAAFRGIVLPKSREYSGFADGAEIADYAKEAIGRFYMAGIINGRGGNVFDPKGAATRAEIAVMLMKFMGFAAEPSL